MHQRETEKEHHDVECRVRNTGTPPLKFQADEDRQWCGEDA